MSSWDQTTKQRISFSPIFSTNFSQFEELKKMVFCYHNDMTWCMRHVAHINRCYKTPNVDEPWNQLTRTRTHNNHVPLFTFKFSWYFISEASARNLNKRVLQTKYVIHPFHRKSFYLVNPYRSERPSTRLDIGRPGTLIAFELCTLTTEMPLGLQIRVGKQYCSGQNLPPGYNRVNVHIFWEAHTILRNLHPYQRDRRRVFSLWPLLLSYTVNVYRYKTIGANANTSVIPTTWKSLSPCVEIL